LLCGQLLGSLAPLQGFTLRGSAARISPGIQQRGYNQQGVHRLRLTFGRIHPHPVKPQPSNRLNLLGRRQPETARRKWMGQPPEIQLDKHAEAQGADLHQFDRIVFAFHGLFCGEIDQTVNMLRKLHASALPWSCQQHIKKPAEAGICSHGR
jgi:hypothetical protein